MAAEVEEKYSLENGLPRYRVLDMVYDFNKKHGRYPAKVILNPKHQNIGSTFFIPFQTTSTPAIKPLEEDKDIEAHEVQGYYVDIEYNKGVDEKTLICRGFAKTS